MMVDFFDSMVNTPMFGFLLTVFLYELGVWIQQKSGKIWANPLVFAGFLIIILLKTTGISLDTYNNGAQYISMFLAPCTAVLAVNIYTNMATVKKYLVPILCGTAAAAAASMISITLMCRLFGFTDELWCSLLPKSVTTAIATPLVQMTGGMDGIVVGATMVTGVSTAIAGPALVKLFRIKDPVAAGIAMGSAGHGIGTTSALKLGPVQGATSGIAIGMSGMFTVIYYAFLFS